MKYLLLCSALLGAQLAAGAAGAAPRISALSTEDAAPECGCSFRAKGAKILAWADGEAAVMRVDGKLVRLQVSEKLIRQQVEGSASLGDETHYHLSGDGVSADAACVIDEVCALEDDSCETTGMRAVITVKAASGTTSVKAAGICGC